MASCVGNIHIKNCQNLIIGFKVTVKNVGDVFWDSVVRIETCFCYFFPSYISRVLLTVLNSLQSAFVVYPPAVIAVKLYCTFGPEIFYEPSQPYKYNWKICWSGGDILFGRPPEDALLVMLTLAFYLLNWKIANWLLLFEVFLLSSYELVRNRGTTEHGM